MFLGSSIEFLSWVWFLHLFTIVLGSLILAESRS